MKNKTRMLLSLLLTLTLVLGLLPGMSSTAYADTATLTLNDGTTTNSYVPLYGFYADAYLNCQFVIPASDLESIAGAKLNKMTFYASQGNVSWGGAQFDVYVGSYNGATISAFEDVSSHAKVYSGSLFISNNTMDVNFSTDYEYTGGDLLVSVRCVSTGSYVTSSWYGVARNGASVQGYNYSNFGSISPSQRNFAPKVTLTYLLTPVTGVTLDKTSTTIAVNGVVALTATVSPNDATDKKVKWSVGGTNADAVKLYTDSACTTEVGTDATETLTVYANGKSVGSATVTATSNENSNKYATCAVTVRKAPVTGDTADFGLWAALLLAGLAGMGIALTMGKRRKARQ